MHSPSGNRRLTHLKGDSSVQSVIHQSLDFGRESENQKIRKSNQTKQFNPIVHPLLFSVWFRNFMPTVYTMLTQSV